MNSLLELKQRLYYRYFADFRFIHINKCGGSSIEKALGIPFAHRTALQYKHQIGDDRWQDIFSFAIVRNPWDKVVSHYHYRVMTNQTNMGTDPLNFNDWVKLAFRENYPQYYDKPKMFMPQADWIMDERGNIIVDFIGRFETLAADFNLICKKIGKPDVQLPHLKNSPRKTYMDYYSEESRQIVGSWFARDIEIFRYHF